MFRAAIFDMDGLMIDTERLHHESFKAVLEQHGITPVPNALGVIHISGISAEANWDRFKQQYGFEGNTEELTKSKNSIHLDLLKDKVVAMPGLLDLLKDLKKHQYKIAIGSSSIREHIDLVIDRLGIAEYFDAISSGDEVTNGKPSPDIFLNAAAKLNTEPTQCIVFEDAMNGMHAAKAANMKVVVVPNEFTRNENFNDADAIVLSLVNVNSKMLESLAS